MNILQWAKDNTVILSQESAVFPPAAAFTLFCIITKLQEVEPQPKLFY